MGEFIRRATRVARRTFNQPPVISAGIWTGYTKDALALVEHVDCNFEHLSRSQQRPERVNPNIENRTCNWYVPAFENPFYGGIMTILRLAAHLHDAYGVGQRFVLCGSGDEAKVSATIVSAFPSLAGAEIYILNSSEKITRIPPSDYSVATLWNTAYTLLKVQNTGYKFYMIQDYEPLFYPAGSTYAQAELTYRFGFYGIVNTEPLLDVYAREYGGTGVALVPSIDPTVFHPGPPLRTDGVKRLFYYARPGTPRNGFELAAVALRRLKAAKGDEVDIVCAGANWNTAEYGLQGVMRNVGVLSLAGTGDLYRTCHASLLMMMTRHPSYLPFELMACGALVVSNVNPINNWLLADGETCLLSPPTASCLTATLARALDDYAALEQVRRKASDVIRARYADWPARLNNVARFMHNPPHTHGAVKRAPRPRQSSNV